MFSELGRRQLAPARTRGGRPPREPLGQSALLGLDFGASVVCLALAYPIPKQDSLWLSQAGCGLRWCKLGRLRPQLTTRPGLVYREPKLEACEANVGRATRRLLVPPRPLS